MSPWTFCTLSGFAIAGVSVLFSVVETGNDDCRAGSPPFGEHPATMTKKAIPHAACTYLTC
ncbi:hypothetical protein [Kibdelosporangium philippinense]|uniref:hypothetical protein n=1 Tax=Kibdelosporangium philippinense TaxID=211113 RepID=UPI0036176A6A